MARLQFDENENTCKGLIYKLRVSRYLDSKGNYVKKRVFVRQRRLSCKGCDRCGWLLETLSEDVSYDITPIVQEYHNNGYYRLITTNHSYDRESGVMDGWNMEFVYISEQAEGRE